MAASLDIPKFATETEEADWWYDHRDIVEGRLRDAIENGTASNGSVMRRVLEARANIKLDAEDAARARSAAARKGMTYEAYVKMLVHEALDQAAA